MFLANNFALSDAEDNTSGLLNRGSLPIAGVAGLPLLRTLLVICQRSHPRAKQGFYYRIVIREIRSIFQFSQNKFFS